MAERAVFILTWADGVLALLLPIFYLVWTKGLRRSVPAIAHRWVFEVGLALCLAWWVLLFDIVYAKSGAAGMVSIRGNMFFPPVALGGEVGAVGWGGFSGIWKLFPGAFAGLNALIGVELLSSMVGAHLR